MAKLINFDGWNRWVSERDGGLLRDGVIVVTENMPLPSRFPEQLSKEQMSQAGRQK